MNSKMKTNIKIGQKLLQRIVLVSIAMSIVLGTAQFFYQFELLDDQVISRADSESRVVLEIIRDYKFDKKSIETPETQETLLGLEKRFPIIELYDADHIKILEHGALASDWIEDELKHYPPHGFGQAGQPEYRRLNIHGSWYWQIVLPLQNNNEIDGYFEGIYHLDDKDESDLVDTVLFSVLIVVLATLSTALVIYPILMRLTEQLSQQSRAVLLGNIELMEVMGEAIARRDSDTNIHNYRVTLYAILLAEETGVLADEMASLIAGSFLHDVGKIGISDAILLKPGKLTSDEYAIMKTHVSIGAQILARASWLDDARDIPRFHHEKFDGTGYMLGLSGEDIPLSARIFAIVDVFDALTAQRPYKDPMPFNVALSIIEEGKNQHFDPNLVVIFLRHAHVWYEQIYTLPVNEIEQLLREKVTKYFSI